MPVDTSLFGLSRERRLTALAEMGYQVEVDTSQMALNLYGRQPHELTDIQIEVLMTKLRQKWWRDSGGPP